MINEFSTDERHEALSRGFKTLPEYAAYIVGLKRELRKAGVSFEREAKTVLLEQLVRGNTHVDD